MPSPTRGDGSPGICVRLQNGLPMSHLTDAVSKPPGPYASLQLREFRPVPPRAPLPHHHTLPVRCAVWSRGTPCGWGVCASAAAV